MTVMTKIYSLITLTTGLELVGNRPPTHYRYHPLDDSRLIPVVSPAGRVTRVSVDAIATIEIHKPIRRA